jgi:hypothetical protein
MKKLIKKNNSFKLENMANYNKNLIYIYTNLIKIKV